MTTRKIMTPAMRGKRSVAGDSRSWVVGDLRILFYSVSPKRFVGVEHVWVDDQSRVPVTHRERTNSLPLIHEYDDSLATTVVVYSLEEIVAEKLRGLRQSEARRVTRGWTRPRARDFYDLWRILSGPEFRVNRANVRRILDAKCAVRHVSWKREDDFFAPGLVAEVEAAWKPLSS